MLHDFLFVRQSIDAVESKVW